MLLRARRLEQLARAAANSVGAVEAEEHARAALDLYRAEAQRGDSAARDGVSSAALLLGRVLHARAQFAEVERLAGELLGELGEARDAPTARLLMLRAQGTLAAWDLYEPAGRDVARALEIAGELGDAELELTALELMTQVRAERGDRDVGWAELEQAARRAGRWQMVVKALRARAADRVDDEPETVAPLLAPAAALAEAHGLVEESAWCDYVLAEAGLCAGSWDAALEHGLRAIAVGEERGFMRVVVRSWFVLLPIAQARGREDLVRSARSRFGPLGTGPSDSSYARIMVSAVLLRFADFGLEPSFVPELEWALPSFGLDHGGPSWLAAVETVVEAWLTAGAHDAAERALDRMRARIELSPSGRLAPAIEALLRARLRCAQHRPEDAAAEARRSLDLLEERAPWWRGKAIRVLEASGGADERLLEVASALESRLGLAPTHVL